MTQEVNIIVSDTSDPIIDASGNLKSCKNKKALGDKIDCNQDYEFTPLSCYRNPVTWTELFIIILIKIIFVIVFYYSEDWGWALVYLSTLIGFIFYIYVAATYDYSYSNILHLSNFYENPWWIFWTIVMNILFYVVMILCGIVVWGDNKFYIVLFFEIIIWATLLAILIADAYRYLLHKHLLLDIANSLGLATPPKSSPDQKPNNCSGNKPLPKQQEDEVFNIAENKYTYKEAKAVCKAFGAQLANYEQIEDAYLHGAEWVNYGWSEGQYAYFPLQKETWKKMDQNNPENANGKVRPGISGGFFANSDLKFGVNCFGKKPKRREQDIRDILPGNPPVKPEDKELNEKVEFYKKNAKLHAFSTKQWYKDPTKTD